jgi:hypothetical protein
MSHGQSDPVLITRELGNCKNRHFQLPPPFALLQLEKLQLTILGDMEPSIYNASQLFYKSFNKKKKKEKKIKKHSLCKY